MEAECRKGIFYKYLDSNPEVPDRSQIYIERGLDISVQSCTLLWDICSAFGRFNAREAVLNAHNRSGPVDVS